MLTIYNFDLDTTDELLQTLARNMQRRRLEKGLSREALSEPLYGTMEELDMIHKNKNRKRGRNEMGK